MKTRIITALLILLCVIPPLVLGGWLIMTLLSFIIIVGGLELLALHEGQDKWPICIKPMAILCVFILLYAPKSMTLPLFGMMTLCFLSIPIFTEHIHAKDSFLCITYITFFFAIASAFLTIYRMDKLMIWFIIIATYACDTGAYFCGRFLGKHKLNVRISPKKTWEGAIGGWVLGASLSFLFAYFFMDSMEVAHILFASVVLAMTGQIGDLACSAIKRNFGIKDFSDLLPGHGGVIDRIDSLIFNFICFNFLLVVFAL